MMKYSKFYFFFATSKLTKICRIFAHIYNHLATYAGRGLG